MPSLIQIGLQRDIDLNTLQHIDKGYIQTAELRAANLLSLEVPT